MSTFNVEDIIKRRRLEKMTQGQQRQKQQQQEQNMHHRSTAGLFPSSQLQQQHDGRFKGATGQDIVASHFDDRLVRRSEGNDSSFRNELSGASASLQQLRQTVHPRQDADNDSEQFKMLVENERRRQESLQQEEILRQAIEQQTRRMGNETQDTRNAAALRAFPHHSEEVNLSMQQEVVQLEDEITEKEERIRLLKRTLLVEEQALIELLQRRVVIRGAGRSGMDCSTGIATHYLNDRGGTMRDQRFKPSSPSRFSSNGADAASLRRRAYAMVDEDDDKEAGGAKRFKAHHSGGPGTARGSVLKNTSSAAKRSPSKLMWKEQEDDSNSSADASVSSSTGKVEETIPVTTNAETGGVSVAISTDVGLMSSYQTLVRTSLEFFIAKADDVSSNTKGRKKEIFPGQVGVRCKFCATRPSHWRGRGSVYYPGKLSGVYQAAQNMAVAHLLEYCSEIPDELKKQLGEERRNQRILDRRGGGKKYWMESCYKMGLREREGQPGLFWAAHLHAERIGSGR